MSKGKELQLPLSRIRTIMKSSPDVENIGQDALHLVTKATELFIQLMTSKAYFVNKSKELGYTELSETVQDSDNMIFLREILPKKITVEEYRKIIKEKEINEKDKKKINGLEDDLD